MDNINSNDIRKFRCGQCYIKANFLICKTDKLEVGYLCQNCWNIYDKRMKQIYGKC